MILLGLFFHLIFSDDFTYDPSNQRAIQRCTTNAVSIVVPAKAVIIQEGAFTSEFCPYLRTVTFEPGSVLSHIDRYAFARSVIETIVFPPNPIDFGISPFRLMEKLNTLNFTGDLSLITAYFIADCPNLRFIYLNGKTLLRESILNLSAISVTTTISRSAFALTSIIEVYVPVNYQNQSLTAYENLFEDCGHVRKIVIDYPLPRIPTSMFHGCNLLQTMTIAEAPVLTNFNLDFRGDYVSVKQLMSGSFRGTGIKTVNIPDDFINISNDAFTDCADLETIIVASPFSIFAHPDFQGLSSLTDVSIGGLAIIRHKTLDLTGAPIYYIEAFEFSETDLQEIILPTNCRRLFNSCFSNCKYLTKVTLSPNVDFVSHSVFSGCINLDTIKLGDDVILQNGVFDVSQTSLRSIANSTFEYTGKINTLVICESLNISKNAFRMSFGLNIIRFTSSRGITLSEDAFRECPQIQAIVYTNGVTCSSLSNIDLKLVFRDSNVVDKDWCSVNSETKTLLTPSSENSSSDMSVGVVAAIAIVIILIVAAVIVGVFFIIKKTTLCSFSLGDKSREEKENTNQID